MVWQVLPSLTEMIAFYCWHQEVYIFLLISLLSFLTQKLYGIVPRFRFHQTWMFLIKLYSLLCTILNQQRQLVSRYCTCICLHCFGGTQFFNNMCFLEGHITSYFSFVVQNSYEELLQLFENYHDHFQIAPAYPLYMRFISSYSNNIFARQQFRKQKTVCNNTKSNSSAQVHCSVLN